MTNPSSQLSIDLNCDLGEDPARIADGSDAALLALVTSCNIACGGHAGDDATMAATIRAALTHNVALGAHPGFPDRANFGRLDQKLAPAELEATVHQQILALHTIARANNAALSHVKPHGALYHAAMTRPSVADAIARATARVSSSLVLVGLAGSPTLELWRSHHLPVAAEAFADRRYEPDGSLRSRTLPDALLADPKLAAVQAVSIATGNSVIAFGNAPLAIHAQTICIHSDSPGSLEIARAVRAALQTARVDVRPIAPR